MAWVKLFRRQAGGNLGKVYQPGSVLSLAPAKGLFNEPGQNSCFLNSAVQVLWQLDIFRRSLRGLTGHVCLGEACIFCALKSIFAQFQTSREKVLPSDAMRHALAESFKDEHRFQLGFMDDAAECFENILQRIHFHIVPNSEGDMCTSKSCITHQKFAMTLYEQCVCRSCGASSDPLPFTEFVRYISTTALCNEVDRMLERHERLKPEMFAELLQAANTADDFRKCPSNCGQKIKIRRVLMNCPEIVTIGLVWDSENSDLTQDVVRNLATQLYLPGLFFRVTDEQAKESRLYLVGMICYTSHHYCAFAYHTKSARWILFDDASVKEVGTKWKDVVTKCIRCHYQPLLLFYANPDGTAVTTDDALRQVMHWSHYKRIFNSDDTANERMSATSKKTDYNRDRDFEEHVYQNSGYKYQTDDSGFNRGVVQSSAGRGPVKLGHSDHQEKIKDLSRECAQRVNNLKSAAAASSSHRRIVDKTQRKELPRPKEPSSGGVAFHSKSFSGPQQKSVSPPPVNGFRQYPDPHFFSSQGKGPYKQQRQEQHSKQMSSPSAGHTAIPEPKPLSRVKNHIATGSDTDSSLEYREKGNGRSKKPWRPMRETLNVDSIFSENEKSQLSPRHLANSNGKHQTVKDHSLNHCSKESPKKKAMMTIYEDEVKQESGSRSSLESLGKGPMDRNKLNPESKMYHLDSWQRAESGYESSDHISSGSSNLDSPIIEGTSFADMKGLQETNLSSDQQPGNGYLTTLPHNRSQLNGFSKDYNGLERNRCDDRLSPVPRDSSHSPSCHRKQAGDFKRDVRSPTLSSRIKEYSVKEMQVNKPDDAWEQSHRLTSCSSKNCCLHLEHSSLAQTNVLNTNRLTNLLLQPSASSSQTVSQCNRVQYMNTPSSASDEIQSYNREDNCNLNNHDFNSIPPPLPLKMYNRSAIPRTEQNFAPATNAHLGTLSHVHSAGSERLSPGAFVRPDSDSDYYPKNDAFHSNGLQMNTIYDCRSKMGLQTLALDPIPHVNDTVALTTFFSVDNCMTDTYRLNYHQKPNVYMTDRPAFQREPGHLKLAGTFIEPSYTRTIDNAHHSLSQPKASFGSVPCNR